MTTQYEENLEETAYIVYKLTIVFWWITDSSCRVEVTTGVTGGISISKEERTFPELRSYLSAAHTALLQSMR